MKKMTLMAVSFLLCLYLIGCGSPDRSQQDKEQLTAQAADMTQEAREQEHGSLQIAGDVDSLHEKAQTAQTEWDGQEKDPQDASKKMKTAEDWEKALGQNYNAGYTINEDGTYTFEGETFQYKILLGDGKTNGGFLVLTNNENLTYDDVFAHLISSDWVEPDSDGETEFVMLKILGENDEEEINEQNGRTSRPYRVKSRKN